MTYNNTVIHVLITYNKTVIYVLMTYNNTSIHVLMTYHNTVIHVLITYNNRVIHVLMTYNNTVEKKGGKRGGRPLTSAHAVYPRRAIERGHQWRIISYEIQQYSHSCSYD